MRHHVALYSRTIKRGSLAVVLFWFGCLLWGFFDGLSKFPRLADNNIPPTPGTKGNTAHNKLDVHFPELNKLQPWTVVVHSDADTLTSADLFPKTKQIFVELESFFVDWENDHKHEGMITEIETYFTYYNKTDFEDIAARFISVDQKTVIMTFNVDLNVKQLSRYAMYEDFKSKKDELMEKAFGDKWDEHLSLGLTSQDALADDANTVIMEDLSNADMITMPFAFLVLAYMIQSWKLLLISLFNLGTVILTSFAIMTVVVNNSSLPNQSITPQFMEVMALAISIDYSLFMFTRFQKELKESDGNIDKSIELMLTHAGHVILMSGSCLVISFCGFLLLDCAFITQIAIGNTVTIVLCIVVSLTSTPAFLHLFPNFFASPKQCPDRVSVAFREWYTKCCPTFSKSKSQTESLLDNLTEAEKEHERMKRSRWYRLTKFTTVWPRNLLVLALCYGLAALSAYKLFDLKITTDFTVGIPHSAAAYKSLKLLSDSFGAGVTQPLWILQVGNGKKNSVKSEEFFSAGIALMNDLTEHTVLGWDNINTVMLDSNFKPVNWSTVEKNLETDPVTQYEWQDLVSANNESVLIQITTPFDPNTGETKTFIKHVYHVIDLQKQNNPDYKFYFCGYKVYESDTIEHAWARFPLMIGFTVAAVFVLMGMFLQSAFVPVRLLFTLGVPIAATYGIAVAVYQDGILAWTTARTFRRIDEGFYWDIPVICFSIIVGLALDYDCFLITRVAEYRGNGYSAQAAILKAVYDTAGIITAAGIIMSLAFATMLLMSAGAVIQTGWLLTSSVLLDTFVVRTIVVPAVMSLADGIGWWPRKVPQDNLMDEFGDVIAERSRVLPHNSPEHR